MGAYLVVFSIWVKMYSDFLTVYISSLDFRLTIKLGGMGLSCDTEKVKAEVMKKAEDGRISCTTARQIAKDMEVAVREVGHACDELKIKIYACELGCF